jgi:hypothetical protein
MFDLYTANLFNNKIWTKSSTLSKLFEQNKFLWKRALEQLDAESIP